MNDGFEAITDYSVFRMERSLGNHLTLACLYNKHEEKDEPDSFEYWIEIDKIKIPSSVGYCRTEEEFKVKVLESGKTLGISLVNDFIPLLTDQIKP